MTEVLPTRPDLERLRREARAAQRASGQPLTKAQAALARGYGFASWPALKAEAEARRANRKPKSAAELDAEALAEQWFTLAEAEDLRPLGRAFAVGKGRKDAARDVMQRDGARYPAFQASLVRGLESRRERVRAECAHALDQFGNASTRAPLARMLDDPVPRVRRSAMHALTCHACGGDKPGRLEPALRERIVAAALGDPSPRVRYHAAMALALARETGAAPVLEAVLARETDPKIRRGVAWALSELARPAKPARPAL